MLTSRNDGPQPTGSIAASRSRFKRPSLPICDNRADFALADSALVAAAVYDRLRLSLYRDNGTRGSLISIASVGSATLLRFEDVGYFNRVYAPDDSIGTRLDTVERFYHGSAHGCCLVAPAMSGDSSLARACAARGWRADAKYAWLAARTLNRTHRFVNTDYEVRPPRYEERELFLYSYLTAFGAVPDRHVMAVENMRHLFSVPDLYFLFALRAGRPAGIGMMHRTGSSAYFCAGATLPDFRGQGCHHALLRARLRLARDLGCSEVYAYAPADGQSQTNMESVGMRIVRTMVAWRFPAEIPQ